MKYCDNCGCEMSLIITTDGAYWLCKKCNNMNIK